MQHDIGKSVIDLSLTRTMAQRQEDFAATLLPLTHRFLHDRHTARVIMLGTQTVEDALSRMSLLPVNRPITLQNLVDYWQERLQLRRSRLRQPVTRRLTVSQNLRQRVPVNTVLGTRRPLAQFPVQNATANLNPLLHIGVHPCPPQQVGSDDFGFSESLIRLLQVIIWALRFSSDRHSPPGATFSNRRLQTGIVLATHAKHLHARRGGTGNWWHTKSVAIASATPHGPDRRKFRILVLGLVPVRKFV